MRATRSPLLIDSAVERISLLRRNVVNDGMPMVSSSAAIVNATISSRSVKPRANDGVGISAISVLPVDPARAGAPAPDQPLGRPVVLRLLAWSTV